MCSADVCATGRSLVERSSAECCMSQCGRGNLTSVRARCIRGRRAMKKYKRRANYTVTGELSSITMVSGINSLVFCFVHSGACSCTCQVDNLSRNISNNKQIQCCTPEKSYIPLLECVFVTWLRQESVKCQINCPPSNSTVTLSDVSSPISAALELFFRS